MFILLHACAATVRFLHSWADVQCICTRVCTYVYICSHIIYKYVCEYLGLVIYMNDLLSILCIHAYVNTYMMYTRQNTYVYLLHK